LAQAFLSLPGAFARTGSNSVAVGAGRSATGGALMANDPHLSVVLPNLFLICGIKSPSYHAVGMMVPGVPALGLGRNGRIAWGGTSLHAASSELIDVADLPPGEFRSRRETIRVRGGRDETVTIRTCRLGPIITDAPLFGDGVARTLAMRWVGHLPSDEMTALLGVAKAGGWTAFRAALKDYAVPALTLTYADADGHVGACMAAKLPARPPGLPGDLFAPLGVEPQWQSLVNSTDLPATLDPPDGVVASANNRPDGAPDVAIGWFFSPDDRVQRLRQLTGDGAVTPDLLARTHQDVFMASALTMRDRLLDLADETDLRTDEAKRVVELLRVWDGHYREGEAAPVALELLVYHTIHAINPPDEVELYANSWEPWALLRQDLDGHVPRDRLARAIGPALEKAARGLADHGCWGRFHRLHLAHPFAALPGLKRRYTLADVPAGGGNETLMKTAHGFQGGRHRVKLGAIARHISDMANPDDNRFCLLGGQDGWPGSNTFFDQFALWREGRYVRLPLDPAKVRETHRHTTLLTPS